jgi:hypothetical protein
MMPSAKESFGEFVMPVLCQQGSKENVPDYRKVEVKAVKAWRLANYLIS